MSGFKEYEDYDALGLAELIRNKEVSSEEVCEEAIQRIEQLNPKLNAVVRTFFEDVPKHLRDADPGAPFYGVPFLLKDLEQAYAGVPLSGGCEALKDFIPKSDNEIVRRFKRAGLVPLGHTNTSEFGLMGVTEPDAWGPTRNPWTLDRSPGGSSGGAGAAVASRMVPLAGAGDGGGSIRIPASACGVFGLKPTRGRVPCGPERGELWDGAAVQLGITRSVRDSAALLDVISGREPGDPYDVSPPEGSFLEQTKAKPRSLRIGFCLDSPLKEASVHPDCQKAVKKAEALLEQLGHQVEEVEAPVSGDSVAKAYLMMYFGQVAADLRHLERLQGKKSARQKVEPTTRLLGQIGESFSAGAYAESKRQWNQFSRNMAQFHQRYDLYLTPTMATPPHAIGALKPSSVENQFLKIMNSFKLARLLVSLGMVHRLAIRSLAATPFTQLANLTGQPAMSIPVHWDPAGLPVGVQLIAPFGDEATLFQLAKQIEETQPWENQRPTLLC